MYGMKRYFDITEVSGVLASKRQLSILRARYEWALAKISNLRVLEVACGAGVALNGMSRVAKYLEAWDIDETNVLVARKNATDTNAVVHQKSITELKNIDENSYDVIIAFECVYYFDDMDVFARDCYNALSNGGRLLISSVNPEWHSFNPSPYCVKYFNVNELKSLMESKGFHASSMCAFYDNPTSAIQKIKKLIKKIAVTYGLIPKTMIGKQLLKRIFFGKLSPIPVDIFSIEAEAVDFNESHTKDDMHSYQMFYLECVKNS